MHATPGLRAATLAAGLAAGLAVLAACGDPQGEDPAPHTDVTSSGAQVEIVGRDEADLLLYVSNQSFDDEEVRLSVAVDGVTVVDDDFHVEGQHNWIAFPLGMSPGDHEITAESDSGAVLGESFTVPGDATRYAVIDHWTEDDEPLLTWLFQRRPLAFA